MLVLVLALENRKDMIAISQIGRPSEFEKVSDDQMRSQSRVRN